MDDKKLTPQQVEDLRAVYNYRTKSEKLSWSRKEKKIREWIETELKPIEDEILELTKKKQPILDKINKKRQDMVKDCVHPRAYLTHCGTHIECGFCFNKIQVNNQPKKNDDEEE